MRYIVLSTQNMLLSGFLMKAIRERGDMVPERVQSPPTGSDILDICRALKPDVLFLEVTPYETFDYNTRVEIIRQVRSELPSCRIAVMGDDNAHPELCERLAAAKKSKIVDNFFFASVSGEYLAAALEAM